jgi:hypothetical protein
MTDETDDTGIAQAEAALRPLLTPDFLRLLTHTARTYGWSGDYVEIIKFLEWCYRLAGQPRPTMEATVPYHDC